jgi:transposase
VAGAQRPVTLDPSQRGTLERWARGRRTPYRLVVRSRIVLRSSDGATNRQIARELNVSPLTVACWKSRFALLGVDGISRDAPRFGSRRALSDAKLREILTRTVNEPPPNGTSWSSRSLAQAVGVSHSTVLRVWREHPVVRDRGRLAALAHDPRFQPRSIGVSGVYLSPPHGAVVISDRLRANLQTSRRGSLSSAPGPRGGTRAPKATTKELVELLARIEALPAARSAARLARKEFLAFLGTVAEHGTRGDRSHLLLTPADDSLRSVVVKWSSRSYEISLVDSQGKISLHELVARWLSERSRNPRTEIALTELPRLRRAIERWASELGVDTRPFAWVNSRPI